RAAGGEHEAALADRRHTFVDRVHDDVAVDRASLFEADGRGANVAAHRRGLLNFDSPAHGEITSQLAADDDLSRFDVADHRAAGADDERVRAVQRAIDAAVHSNGAVG